MLYLCCTLGFDAVTFVYGVTVAPHKTVFNADDKTLWCYCSKWIPLNYAVVQLNIEEDHIFEGGYWLVHQLWGHIQYVFSTKKELKCIVIKTVKHPTKVQWPYLSLIAV